MNDTKTKTCIHGDTGIESACEECLELSAAWSSIAGERVGLTTAERYLRERAGLLFGQGKDDMAREVRCLADHMAKLVADAAKQCDEARHTCESASAPT